MCHESRCWRAGKIARSYLVYAGIYAGMIQSREHSIDGSTAVEHGTVEAHEQGGVAKRLHNQALRQCAVSCRRFNQALRQCEVSCRRFRAWVLRVLEHRRCVPCAPAWSRIWSLTMSVLTMQ